MKTYKLKIQIWDHPVLSPLDVELSCDHKEYLQEVIDSLPDTKTAGTIEQIESAQEVDSSNEQFFAGWRTCEYAKAKGQSYTAASTKEIEQYAINDIQKIGCMKTIKQLDAQGLVPDQYFEDGPITLDFQE